MIGRVRSLPSATRVPLRYLLAAVAVLAIAGCAVGPDFHRPAAPDVGRLTAAPLPATTASADVAGGRPQHFVPGADIPAQWWTLFHSPALNALIEQALAHNPDIKAAQAALAVARENTRAGRGAYYPAVSAGMSATAASRIRPVRWRRYPATTPSCTTCSRRRSACRTCPMCSG